MSIQIKAVFENGLLRPLQAVRLEEKQEVTVIIEALETGEDEARFVLRPDRWQAFCAALDAPPREIPALRKLLTEASAFDGRADPTANAGAA